MIQRFICMAAGALLGSGLLIAESDLNVRKAELSTMFGSAAGYIAAVNGEVVFVNTEKPEMSLHIPAKIITSSSLNEGTVTIITSEAVHGLSTFHFKLADPSANFALSSGPSAGQGGRGVAVPAGSIATNSAESPGLMKTFDVRHRHFPRGGCQGRLIVRKDRVQFESMTEIGHSELWRMSDIKEIKRKNPYKVELKPFQGPGYDFEVLRQGMSLSDFELITERVADRRMSQLQ